MKYWPVRHNLRCPNLPRGHIQVAVDEHHQRCFCNSLRQLREELRHFNRVVTFRHQCSCNVQPYRIIRP